MTGMTGQDDDRAGRRRRTRLRSSIGLGVVGLAAGLLFSTNASMAAHQPDRRPSTLPDLVRVEQDRLAETNAEVTALNQEVAALLSAAAEGDTSADPRVELAAGRVPVAGPGITVELWDAPTPAQIPDGLRADSYLVHQQDIESVMNGLWAGGAEAMTVQGHRITAMTSVRCVGNVLLIDGAIYSPPYVIAAIGDPVRLEQTLLATEPIQIYLQYVDIVNLGWSLTQEDRLQMTADEKNLTMEYAHVPG